MNFLRNHFILLSIITFFLGLIFSFFFFHVEDKFNQILVGIGVVIGALIAISGQYIIQDKEQKNKLIIATLEDRLNINQELYNKVRQLFLNLHSYGYSNIQDLADEKDNIINFKEENVLLIDSSVYENLNTLIANVTRLIGYVQLKHKTKVNIFDFYVEVINQCVKIMNLIRRSFELPPISEKKSEEELKAAFEKLINKK